MTKNDKIARLIDCFFIKCYFGHKLTKMSNHQVIIYLIIPTQYHILELTCIDIIIFAFCAQIMTVLRSANIDCHQEVNLAKHTNLLKYLIYHPHK